MITMGPPSQALDILPLEIWEIIINKLDLLNNLRVYKSMLLVCKNINFVSRGIIKREFSGIYNIDISPAYIISKLCNIRLIYKHTLYKKYVQIIGSGCEREFSANINHDLEHNKRVINMLKECRGVVFSSYNGNVDFLDIFPNIRVVYTVDSCIYTSKDIYNVGIFGILGHGNGELYPAFPNLKMVKITKYYDEDLVNLMINYGDSYLHTDCGLFDCDAHGCIDQLRLGLT